MALLGLPAAIFFDVDFTLIQPGPRFQGLGYCETCAKHGVTVDPARFDEALAGAASLLESEDHSYDSRIFELYTRRIIELMGDAGGANDAAAGTTPAALERAAREIFDDWAEYRHFTLYPDVPDALRELHNLGARIGLISNTDRCLDAFASHFALDGLIEVVVSSADHGFMKPHPSIFRAALDRMGVAAAEAAMVGDSLVHDVRGALEVGMRGVLLWRSAPSPRLDADVPVIRSLDELARLLGD